MTRQKYIITIIILLSTMGLRADVPDSLLHRVYPSLLKDYKDYLEHYRPERSSVWFDTDTLVSLDKLLESIVEKGFNSVWEDVHYYITQPIESSTIEERKKEVEKINIFAKSCKSIEVAWIADMIEMNISFFEHRMPEREKIVLRHSERYKGNKWLYMDMRVYAFKMAIVDGQYLTAFRLASELTSELEEVTDAEFPGKYEAFYSLGELYYLFRDFEKAVSFLEKSLADPTTYFYKRNDMQTRNTLGLYYRTQGDPELSDRYFLSMLASDKIVKYRPMYDAIAKANLGRNCRLRGDYEAAMQLLRLSLPVALDMRDYPFASGVTADMGDCYFNLGQIDRAKDMIDTTIILMHIEDPFHCRHNYLKLYPLMSKYYAKKGDDVLSAVYLDSTIIANKRYEDEFTALTIRKAEQEIFDIDQAIAHERMRVRNNQLTAAVIILLLVVTASIVLGWFYKRKREAYRELVRKSRRWAGVNEKFYDITPPADNVDNTGETPWADVNDGKNDSDLDNDSASIMDNIEQLMNERKLYLKTDITPDTFSNELGISRRRISAVISEHKQMNFSAYVNEYRIKEAIRLLSSLDGNNYSVNAIAFDSGFSDRKYFHRIFKEHTGITPSAFRSNI